MQERQRILLAATWHWVGRALLVGQQLDSLDDVRE